MQKSYKNKAKIQQQQQKKNVVVSKLTDAQIKTSFNPACFKFDFKCFCAVKNHFRTRKVAQQVKYNPSNPNIGGKSPP